MELLRCEWEDVLTKAYVVVFEKGLRSDPVDYYDFVDELNLRIKEGAKRLIELKKEVKANGG